jgi:hypothetical protein
LFYVRHLVPERSDASFLKGFTEWYSGSTPRFRRVGRTVGVFLFIQPLLRWSLISGSTGSCPLAVSPLEWFYIRHRLSAFSGCRVVRNRVSLTVLSEIHPLYGGLYIEVVAPRPGWRR